MPAGNRQCTAGTQLASTFRIFVRPPCCFALLPTHPAECLCAVSCLAFTMHFQLLPVKASLKDPSCISMLRVLRLALVVCSSIYATVAVSGGCLLPGLPLVQRVVAALVLLSPVASGRPALREPAAA